MKGRFSEVWPAVVLVVGLIMVAAAGAAAATDGTADSPVVESASDHADNETDRTVHEDPATASGSGDSGAVADWLAGALGASATDSAVALSDSEYELAREALGDDYDEWQELYDAMAAETGREGTEPGRTRDEQAAETFAEIQAEQTELTELVEAFESTRADYEAARQRGDDDAARSHARELAALQAEIDTTGGTLEERYTDLEAFTGIDFEEARTSINTTTTAAETDAAEATGESFLATTIELESATEAVAFENPLVVEGSLTDENGNAVTDATIALPTPDGVKTTTTDSSGVFELQYRPVALPVDTTALTVEYRPDPTGQYEASTATVGIDVTQTDVELDVSLPTQAASGEEIEPTVTATIGEEPVEGLPIVATIGDTSTQTQTDETGSATPVLTVPSDLTPSTTTVEFVAADGLAVSSESIERELDITEADTESGLIGFGGDGIGGDASDRSLATLGVVLAVVLALIAVAVVVYRRRRDRPGATGEPPSIPVEPAETKGAGDIEIELPTDPEPLSALERARAELPGSPNRAATLAYGHARGALSTSDDTDTHWEFYQACAANGHDEATVQALKTVTEQYERATFAPDGATPDTAAAAIDAAERIETG